MIKGFSIPVPVALVALAALVLGAACGGGDPEKTVYEGRNLEIHVGDPVIAKRAFFSNNDVQYLLEVDDPGTRIVAVNVDVVNRRINITKLRVDAGSVEIGSGRTGERFGALALFQEATTVTEAMPEDETFMPLLWGVFELERGFKSGGWIFFEVPVGLDLDTLWWSAADDIIARF